MEVPKELDEVIEVLEAVGARAYLIGARALLMYGAITRTTKDIDIMITVEDLKTLRDTLTKELRKRGFMVQWRHGACL